MRGVLAVFEPRLGHLSWHVVAPSPPDDVTPDLVRQAVAGSPGAVAVELSAAFLHRRPGSDIGEWRRLDQELESEGIAVYFAPGGAASWEIKVSTGRPPAADKDAESDPESTVEAVTPTNPSSGTGPGVLQAVPAGESAAATAPVESRIAELAGQGLSTRKIAAALEREGYPAVSHMRVARTLRREARLPPKGKEESNANP